MMDGFTLAETIRSDPDLSGPLLMMLTSSDRGGDITRCRKLGIDCYLIKPIRESELLAAVLSVVEGQGGHGAQQLITRYNVRRGERAMRVLIAEDNPVNQKFVHRVLEKMGQIPVTAGSGKEALERFKTDHFDLIFMDVQMPEMDGLSTTAAIREIEKSVGGHTPIFAMTAHALKGDRERCLSAGMDGYVSKPTTVTDIEKVVRGVLAKAQPEAQPRVNVEPSGSVLWDRAAALNRVGGDEALLQELITVFFQEYPTLADRLTEGLSRGDLASLLEPAHTLKGSLGYLGVPDAARLAQEIEDASRAEDTARVADLVDNFMARVKVMQEALACPTATGGEGSRNG